VVEVPLYLLGQALVYVGAVPVDLLRQEQDRLTAETKQAERQLEVAEASSIDIEDTLGKALDLLADCQNAYLAAPEHLRRQWNQALFERLVVYDDDIETAEVAEPFATLADPELPAQLDSEGPRNPPLLLAAVQIPVFSSGRPDLNRGPHRPERCALPGCATPREAAIIPDRGGDYRTASIAASIWPSEGPSCRVRVPRGPLTIAAWWVRMPRSRPSFS
jgi:hypothetical protein